MSTRKHAALTLTVAALVAAVFAISMHAWPTWLTAVLWAAWGIGVGYAFTTLAETQHRGGHD